MVSISVMVMAEDSTIEKYTSNAKVCAVCNGTDIACLFLQLSHSALGGGLILINQASRDLNHDLIDGRTKLLLQNNFGPTRFLQYGNYAHAIDC